MTFADIVKHFGSIGKARSALGLKSRQTLYNWRDNGVPKNKQCHIQLRTRGKLKADEDAKKAA